MIGVRTRHRAKADTIDAPGFASEPREPPA